MTQRTSRHVRMAQPTKPSHSKRRKCSHAHHEYGIIRLPVHPITGKEVVWSRDIYTAGHRKCNTLKEAYKYYEIYNMH
ncbi:hypothetical protein TNCV_905531 [Trichonephila clavipes]|nr:hypothetical protein TNCV_905531 [Trichonephila clavipes]